MLMIRLARYCFVVVDFERCLAGFGLKLDPRAFVATALPGSSSSLKKVPDHAIPRTFVEVFEIPARAKDTKAITK
jgi:hypothetical protein